MQLDLPQLESWNRNVEFGGMGGVLATTDAMQLPTHLPTHFKLRFIFRDRYLGRDTNNYKRPKPNEKC